MLIRHDETLSYPDRRLFRLRALDTVDRIRATASLPSLYALLEEIFPALGFDHFIVSGIPMPHEPVERAVLLRNWPAGWFEMYVRRNFVRVDPVVRMCRSTTMPFEWREAPVADFETERRAVMNFARDFGLMEGLSVPIHGVDGTEACVSLGGRRPLLDATTKPALHLVAIYAHEQARRLVRAAAPVVSANPLTPREREVLTWAAVGKSYAEIADILNITERTVTAHNINAAAKLGAANKTQAVVKAMQAQYIRI